jgi:hypothetical protein
MKTEPTISLEDRLAFQALADRAAGHGRSGRLQGAPVIEVRPVDSLLLLRPLELRRAA